MEVKLPTDCGNAPRIGIVGDFAVNWATGDHGNGLGVAYRRSKLDTCRRGHARWPSGSTTGRPAVHT